MINLKSYTLIKNQISSSTKLVAVSKKQSLQKIQRLYKEGQRDFGENFIQELIQKKKALPKDIKWHFLGNIQSNKIKLIVEHATLIHSVGRNKVYEQILNVDTDKDIKILLQLKLGSENSKGGFNDNEIISILEKHSPGSNVKICGLMGIAENNASHDQRIRQFNKCSDLFAKIRLMNDSVEVLSLGMSNDWEDAVSHGSTMIRIGSKIFGERKQ